MNESWIVISSAEMELAKQCAEEIHRRIDNLDDCVKEMHNLVKKIVAEKQYENINKSCSSEESDISSNFIAQLAYYLSDYFELNNENGVVLTSSVLAEDMVRMSLVEWLSINSTFSQKKLASYIWDNECSLSAQEKESLANKIKKIRWYDPCVGGGAFPISIIKVLNELKVTNVQINGYDLNPLFVEATRIRLALVTNGDFEESYEMFSKNVIVKDSLDSYLPQRTLFNFSFCEEPYDIVIANPPYVKSGRIDRTTKEKYKTNYPEISNQQADLYVYFIAHGMNALNNNGVLTFVSPAQFQISNYGSAIRSVIEEKGGVCTVADFNELPVFKNVGVHTSVYTLAKGYKPKSFLRYEYDGLPERYPLVLLYTEGFCSNHKNASPSGWNFSSSVAHEALSYLESVGTKLRDYLTVYSGIKTGCKQAFFIQESDIKKFSNYDMQFIKKMIIPRKIRRWKSDWSDDYMALIKRNEELDETSEMYKHMRLYKKELSLRSDVIGHSTWYGLRECRYYAKFEEPKIIYPDISTECRFSIDLDGVIIPDGAFFLPGEDYFLLGILNSCIGRYYFREKCARIGNPLKGGRIRFKKVYVENFPIVDRNYDTLTANTISDIARKATKGEATDSDLLLLDDLALKIYRVSEHLLEVFRGDIR